MMKGQLAGLMKQAQQMQENMKKMQDQLALIDRHAAHFVLAGHRDLDQAGARLALL